MLRKPPGIDIPAAIDANILHAAAFLEFKQHVERLAKEGHDLAAYTCWMHALEIRHSLFVIPTTSQHCAAHLGGFKFPWLGLWSSRGVIIRPDVQPVDAWTYYYEHQEKMDLLLLAACRSTTTATDLVPQDMASNSVAQRATLGSWGWEPGAVSQSVDLAILRDESAGHAVWGSATPAFHGVTAVCSVGSGGRCWWIYDSARAVTPPPIPQHFFVFHTLAILLGCAAMASSYYAAQAASSSSSRGDLAQGWNAADSLRQIAAQRAAQWRKAEGLQDDNDFAYAYLDYDQVVALAGHHVADDWLQTRATAGVRAVEGNPKGPALSRPLKNAPARALQALKRMSKNASQEMDLSNLQVPVAPRATGASTHQSPGGQNCRAPLCRR